MSFSNGLGEMGLGELGLGEMGNPALTVTKDTSQVSSNSSNNWHTAGQIV